MIETYGEYKSGAVIIKIEWAIFSQMMHIGRIINVLGALCVATLGRSACQLSSQRYPPSIRLCAPNLGVVELTIGLHRVFNTPKDRFCFDVAHQGYIHKLLTGRNDERFERIRLSDGLSGFLSRAESEHDAFGAGHAGTALSAALGMACARDQRGSEEHVVALCGDAAFTCGITMEALNNVASSTKRLIIILNDNKWSIAKNVGALSRYFNELITTPAYNRLNDDIERFLQKMPGGNAIVRLGAKWKQETKDFFVSSSIFEQYGIRYIGPIDGHDHKQVEHYLEFAKNAEQPVILHVLTEKGRGYDVAIKNPERFHGASPFDIETGKGAPAAPGILTAPDGHAGTGGEVDHEAGAFAGQQGQPTRASGRPCVHGGGAIGRAHGRHLQTGGAACRTEEAAG